MTVAGTSTILNHGDISASARAERGIVNVTVDYAEATGVRAISLPYGDGESIVDNYGSIQAHTFHFRWHRLRQRSPGVWPVHVNQQCCRCTHHGNGRCRTIRRCFRHWRRSGRRERGRRRQRRHHPRLRPRNAYSDGTNGFYGAAGATGISVNASYHGDATVVNNGDVNAIAIAENSVSWVQGGAGATGIYAYAKYGTAIVNAGDVTAIADAEFGVASAYGVVAHDKYSSSIVNEAGAVIVATASVGSLAGDQSAGLAVSFGTKTFGNGTDYAVTYNAGHHHLARSRDSDGTQAPIGSMATAFGSSTGYNSGVLQGAACQRRQHRGRRECRFRLRDGVRSVCAYAERFRHHQQRRHPCGCLRRRRQRLRGWQLRVLAAPDGDIQL
jgi:hypothetical protein